MVYLFFGNCLFLFCFVGVGLLVASWLLSGCCYVCLLFGFRWFVWVWVNCCIILLGCLAVMFGRFGSVVV